MKILKLIVILYPVFCNSLSIEDNFNSKHNVIGNKFNRLLPEVEAKTILSQKNGYGILSTINRKKNVYGYPYGSLVGFSLDSMDKPFFIFSDLSLHTRNLLVNNYASLCVNEYGFKTATDSRISITGNLIKKENKEKYYIEKYIKYHPNADWVNFLDFNVYVMEEIKEISFVGGFGRATRIKINDYNSVSPDPLIFDMDYVIDYVTKNFYHLIKEKVNQKLFLEINEYYIKNIDTKGINIIYDKSQFVRIPFTKNVYTFDDLKIAIIHLISN